MQPESIRKEIILELLMRPEVVRFRTYVSMNEQGKIRHLHVGEDKDGNDVYITRPKEDSASQSSLQNQARQAGQSTEAALVTIPPDEEGVIDMAQGCPSYSGTNPVMLP